MARQLTLVREIHDDGKPESIRTFRGGKLAIVGEGPEERGYLDVLNTDDFGKLTRREVRATDRP